MSLVSIKIKIANNEKISCNRFFRHCCFLEKSIVDKNKLIAKAKKTAEIFGVEFQSKEDEAKQIKDMLKMYRRYGYEFDEYLLYHFESRPMKERLTFVSDWEHYSYTSDMNDIKNKALFDNKWNTYNKYKEYYRRDAVYCDSVNKKDEFIQFAEKHKSYIVKPISGNCGKGIKIVREGDNVSFESLMADCDNHFIAEELIRQVDEMKQFHPSSVNTIRMPIVRFDDGMQVLPPIMRIGQKGNCVDNGGSGGILCPIDIETGTITDTFDEFGHVFTEHPDTHIQIIGFRVPRWEELKEFAKMLSAIVPENRYTSWDFALTDEGWVIVEANRRGQFTGWQINTKVGFREEIEEIIKKIKHGN